MMTQIFGAGGGNGIPVVVVVTAICMVASMNDMVVPSVSLEGKSIWIAQSLPVPPWDALRAKLMVQILVTGIPVLFCDICMCIVLQAGFWELLLGVVVSVLFVLFMALFGLMLGLKMPNLTWTNELAPIKQSISVMIEMFGGWGFSLGILAGDWRCLYYGRLAYGCGFVSCDSDNCTDCSQCAAFDVA